MSPRVPVLLAALVLFAAFPAAPQAATLGVGTGAVAAESEAPTTEATATEALTAWADSCCADPGGVPEPCGPSDDGCQACSGCSPRAVHADPAGPAPRALAEPYGAREGRVSRAGATGAVWHPPRG